MAGGDDLVDKGGPVVWPLLLEDGDEYQVELIDERALALQAFFIA